MATGFYKSLLEALHEGVYFVDRNRVITYWSKGAERITGYSAEQVVGKACGDGILCHVDEAGRHLCGDGCPLARTMLDGEARECSMFLHHREGHRVPVTVRAAPVHEGGDLVGAVEVFAPSIRESQLDELLQRLQDEALQDALTKLGNRRFAEISLDNHLRSFRREAVPFGLLLLDLDRFKRINDTYGHNTGDAVLRAVAATILNGIRPLDIPCRWGGEEFVVILPEAGLEALSVVAERLRALIQTTWLDHEGRKLRISASLGGAVVRPDEDGESLIRRADRQLYMSKRAGRNCVHLDAEPYLPPSIDGES